MTGERAVLLGGRLAGHLEQTRTGRRIFTYDESYRTEGSTPLSLSMPLARAEHGGRVLGAYLWGLLPDDDRVLERWSRQFRVSRHNPVSLLSHVGQDCAGAVQFVAPDRVGESGSGGVEWLSEGDVEQWVRALCLDPCAWLPEAGHGLFSLAGAHAKFALLYDGNRWGRPHGAVPTTHILKPAAAFTSQELNEHLCLRAARALGMPAAASEVRAFGRQSVVVLTRYDRIRQGNQWVRVHQEDLCQALGVPPGKKDQAHGAPGVSSIARLLRAQMPGDVAEDALARFVQAIAFGWASGGTGAHAKNYSLLLAGRQVRLAPLYDLASALPYATTRSPGGGRRSEPALGRLALAMRVGQHTVLREIDRSDWVSLAAGTGLDPDHVLDLVDGVLTRLPDALQGVVADETERGLLSRRQGSFARNLARATAKHVARCRRALAGRSADH